MYRGLFGGFAFHFNWATQETSQVTNKTSSSIFFFSFSCIGSSLQCAGSRHAGFSNGVWA